jgi:hypothetical protein
MVISPVPARVQSSNGVRGTRDRGRERAPAKPSLSQSLPAPSTPCIGHSQRLHDRGHSAHASALDKSERVL